MSMSAAVTAAPPNSSSSSPSRTRSISDAPKPALEASPAFREPSRLSKDDTAISVPSTPKRPSFHARGLSLQMPPRDGNPSTPNSLIASRVPLSPKLDPSHTYGSPASMIPRRSRGLDYTRACTNLHHSTLAESSPDASPTIGGRGMPIPQRRSLGYTILDSPNNISGSLWSSMPGTERPALSSSVSSINMLDSNSDSDSSDDEIMDRDTEDAILTTPQVSKLSSNFLSGPNASPGGEWMSGQYSPAAASLLSFQRARIRKGRSRHNSYSINASASKTNRGPLSPPLLKSIESSNGCYFSQDSSRRQVQSRRESLSMGTNQLHLSDSEDGESRNGGTINALYQSSSSSTPGVDGPRGVVKRAVTRRGNLLPKSKNFARVRAALLEEAAPIDSEAKREAEVIHQVRENDPPPLTSTSPDLSSTNTSGQDALALESPPEDSLLGEDKSRLVESPGMNIFSREVEKHSAGLGFWNDFDDRYRTPPPPMIPWKSSSGMSDESMETPPSSVGGGADSTVMKNVEASRSRSSTPMPGYNAPTAGDVARKVNNKRRRDDDFDPAAFKRRAVSPGLSVQSSPVLPQSPVLTNDRSWGHPPPKTNGHGNVDRSNSGSSTGTKRVGLQGMVETNDSLMNMSIE